MLNQSLLYRSTARKTETMLPEWNSWRLKLINSTTIVHRKMSTNFTHYLSLQVSVVWCWPPCWPLSWVLWRHSTTVPVPFSSSTFGNTSARGRLSLRSCLLVVCLVFSWSDSVSHGCQFSRQSKERRSGTTSSPYRPTYLHLGSWLSYSECFGLVSLNR